MKTLGKTLLWVLGGMMVVIGLLSVVSPNAVAVHLEEEIDAPADQVWAVLAHRFAEIGEWAPGIETSRAINLDEVPAGFTVAPNAPVPGRVTPNPLGELTEVLIMYSEDDRTFTFDTAGLPPIVTQAVNTTRVTKLDDGRSLVTFDIEMSFVRPFNVLGAVIQRRLQTSPAGPGGMIKDLKTYLEHEQPSQALLKD